MFGVQKFIIQISPMFLIIFTLKRFQTYIKVAKKPPKNSSESPHIPFTQLALRDYANIVSPQTSIWHPSVDLPCNSYVRLVMTFYFPHSSYTY